MLKSIHRNSVKYNNHEMDTYPSGLVTPEAVNNPPIIGDKGADTLMGTSEAESIDGLAGDDLIYGYGGDDTLQGGAGNDTLWGGIGNDTLMANGGRRDYLNGGYGDDTYFLDSNDGYVEIRDPHGRGYDRIYSNAAYLRLDNAEIEEITLTDAGPHRVFLGLFGSQVMGGGGADLIVGGAGNDALAGGAGQDTLMGGGGQNSLYGGRGDDVIHTSQVQNDWINGGAGTDRLVIMGQGQDLDLSTLPWALNAGIEELDLGGNRLTFDLYRAAAFSGTGTLRVENGVLDVQDAHQWHFRGFRNDGGQAFRVYEVEVNSRPVNLLVAESVTHALGNTIDLARSINTTRIDGVPAPNISAWTGRAVASVGDVNGDGYADILIGAPNAGHIVDGGYIDATGAAYLLFGSAQGIGNLDLSQPLGRNGVVIEGYFNSDNAGLSVASAGDFNGDGVMDIIVGAPSVNRTDGSVLLNDAGAAYVIFGRRDGFGENEILNVNNLTGRDGIRILGASTQAEESGIPPLLGYSVASAGDVNRDGINDIIVGAPFLDRPGSTGPIVDAGGAYIIYGRSDGFGPDGVLDLARFDASQGVRILGIDAADRGGYAVAGLGDVNGDGWIDLAVTVPQSDHNGFRTGSVFLLFGAAAGFGTNGTVDLANLSAGQGLRIDGEAFVTSPGGRVGIYVASAGDVNGDGRLDIIMGADRQEKLVGDTVLEEAGAAYILFGRDDLASRDPINLSAFTAADGFIVRGAQAFDRVGFTVASAGDFNGDGYGDIIIGSAWADRTDGVITGEEAGAAYLIYGRRDGFGVNGVIDLSFLRPEDGFAILGAAAGERAGSVSSAGDVNGDGFADLLIGAYEASQSGHQSGSVYILYGGNYEPGLNPAAPTLLPDAF